MATNGRALNKGNRAQARASRSQVSLRVPLPVSERRGLLVVGDAVVVAASAFLALWVWARIDGLPFTTGFVSDRWLWLPGLVASWWILGALLDLYDLPEPMTPCRGRR